MPPDIVLFYHIYDYEGSYKNSESENKEKLITIIFYFIIELRGK